MATLPVVLLVIPKADQGSTEPLGKTVRSSFKPSPP